MADRIRSKRFPGVYHRESSRKKGGKPDKVFMYTLRDAAGKQKWVTVGRASEGVTEAFVNQKRIEAINRINHGENPAFTRKKRTTLNELFDVFIADSEANGRHTKPEMSRYNANIRSQYGDCLLDDFTPAFADKLKSSLMGSGLSPASVKQCLALLRKTINFAIRRSMWKGQNAFAGSSGFTMPKVENKGERWLTEKEAAKLLEALEMRSQQVHDMALLSLLYGLRATELFDLLVQDVDRHACVLHVMAKGRRQKVIVDQNAIAVLLKYLHQDPGAHVFQTKNGGRIKRTSKTFDRVVEDLGFNNGIDDNRQTVWFHTLRHTWASWLAQSGKVSLHELMELGRWDNYETVLRYAHLIPDHRREKIAIAASRLSSALADPK